MEVPLIGQPKHRYMIEITDTKLWKSAHFGTDDLVSFVEYNAKMESSLMLNFVLNFIKQLEEMENGSKTPKNKSN